MHQLYFGGFMILIFKFTASTANGNASSTDNAFDVTDKLFKTYDKRVRPYLKEKPLVVITEMDIIKFHALQYEGKYSVDLFLRLAWNDPRLHHNESEYVLFPGESDGKFWSPDVFFENGLKSSKHEVTKLNHYTRLSPNGDILTSTRITVEADCPQDLTQYPFDVQTCDLSVESYSHTTQHIVLKWSNSAIRMLNTNMKQFVVKAASLHESNASYSTGMYSHLNIRIKFERRIGYYIFQVFIPCNVVVLLAFVQLWMNPENIGDRIALGITTVLTIVFLMESINSYLPKVSYIKAIDGYLIGCFLLVFVTVVETVAAFYSVERTKEPLAHGMTTNTSKSSPKNATESSIVLRNGDAVNNLEEPNSARKTEVTYNTTENCSKSSEKNSRVDAFCKILFPLIFIGANSAYWAVMMAKRK